MQGTGVTIMDAGEEINVFVQKFNLILLLFVFLNVISSCHYYFVYNKRNYQNNY